MHLLIATLPELRYVKGLTEKQRKKYLKGASPQLVECFYQIGLNFLYAGKDTNGIMLEPAHIKRLKKHKKSLISLVRAQNSKTKRKHILKGGFALELLSLLSVVIASLASAL